MKVSSYCEHSHGKQALAPRYSFVSQEGVTFQEFDPEAWSMPQHENGVAAGC